MASPDRFRAPCDHRRVVPTVHYVHPEGQGLGKDIISNLVERSGAHKKIILYANPDTEGFYARLGFLRMNTAMAIWRDPEAAIASGLISVGREDRQPISVQGLTDRATNEASS